ncbi:mediator complex subunit, partial [Kluyveromyces marxianus]
MDDWRSSISAQERTQFVTELAQILADMSRINGGEKANFNLEKLKKSAEQFESSLYASCNSKELYLDAMRKRIAAMDSAKR